MCLCRKYAFKTSFSGLNIHLYLCWQVEDTKWKLCCRKIGVKRTYNTYLRFQNIQKYFIDNPKKIHYLLCHVLYDRYLENLCKKRFWIWIFSLLLHIWDDIFWFSRVQICCYFHRLILNEIANILRWLKSN